MDIEAYTHCVAIVLATLWLGAAAVAFAAPVVLETLPGGGHSSLRQECHHNARRQLVCRMCWNDQGTVRCHSPRIVR